LNSDLEKIIKLQQIDTETDLLRDRIREIPLFIQQIEESIKLKNEEFKQRGEQFKTRKVELKSRDLELKSAEENITKKGGELYKVKTNEAYRALEKEIEDEKNKKEGLEETILLLMDAIDSGEKQLAEEKMAFEKEISEFENQKKILQDETREKEERVKKFEQEKASCVSGVNPQLLGKYERIRKSKYGLAVVPIIEEKICGGCQINLPQQKVNEVLSGKDIVLCEHCSRILYIQVKQESVSS